MERSDHAEVTPAGDAEVRPGDADGVRFADAGPGQSADPAGAGHDGVDSHLVVDGVTKRFGRVTAVRNVAMRVDRGEFVALFGPNGAGKSTLLRMVAALSRPTDGRILLDGDVVAGDRPSVRRQVGVVTHQTMHYDGLSARENLRLHARLHGVSDVTGRVRAVLDRVGLAGRASDRPSTFSHGMAKRLALARALLHDPAVLLLDEPYAGLDRRAAAVLSSLLDGMDDRTVVLSTHGLERGFDHATRAVVLSRGRVQFDRPTAAFEDQAAFAAAYERAVEEAQR
jgi:heme exporter protein A